MKIKTRLLLITSLLFSINLLNGQIVVSSGEDVLTTDLVESILGEGIQYSNVMYQGSDSARGIFTNGLTTNLGLESGIILSSGYANLIQGPNDDCSATASISHGLSGYNYLNGLVNYPSYDAAVLGFDLIPESDTLKINYVFGSEEYDEWVNFSTVDDVFGCFIWGPNPDTSKWNYNGWNFAIVPGTMNSPISIKNINNGESDCDSVPNGPCNNCEYYINNLSGLTIQYDAFTTVLTAVIPVIPCETYHMKLAIADVGGEAVDSGVTIEANSITAPFIEIETISSNPEISENLVEGCVEMDVVFRLPDVSYSPCTIELEIIESPTPPYADNWNDYIDGNTGQGIDSEVVFPVGQDSVVLNIYALYDQILEGDELIGIVVVNDLGCQVRYDTITLTIEDYAEMQNTISQPQVICDQSNANLWVSVENGVPPYSYIWEPGGYTDDIITVEPDTTTTYSVIYTDQCGKSGIDSTTVTVIPHLDFATFYFEAALNPGLPFDVHGELLDDTIMVVFPSGTNLENLIASYTIDGPYLAIYANGEVQEPGVTPNDFSEPIVYWMFGPIGCTSEWIVICEVEVGQNEFAVGVFIVKPGVG